MTNELERLEAIARAATPGPWTGDQHGLGVYAPKELGGWGLCQLYNKSGAMSEHEANAAHIAAFDPPTVLKLLAVWRAARSTTLDFDNAHSIDGSPKYRDIESLLAALQALEEPK